MTTDYRDIALIIKANHLFEEYSKASPALAQFIPDTALPSSADLKLSRERISTLILRARDISVEPEIASTEAAHAVLTALSLDPSPVKLVTSNFKTIAKDWLYREGASLEWAEYFVSNVRAYSTPYDPLYTNIAEVLTFAQHPLRIDTESDRIVLTGASSTLYRIVA